MISDDPDIRGAYNTKHPPSEHAMKQLRWVDSFGIRGVPAQEVNFTVRDKLLAFEYITLTDAPSSDWYKTHKPGRTVTFMYVTDKGRDALKG